jgi:hypothetical protein
MPISTDECIELAKQYPGIDPAMAIAQMKREGYLTIPEAEALLVAAIEETRDRDLTPAYMVAGLLLANIAFICKYPAKQHKTLLWERQIIDRVIDDMRECSTKRAVKRAIRRSRKEASDN